MYRIGSGNKSKFGERGITMTREACISGLATRYGRNNCPGQNTTTSGNHMFTGILNN